MGLPSRYRTVLGFLTVYLLLSVPPFLYLNQAVLGDVVEQLSVFDREAAVWLVSALVVFLGLFRASEGIQRYNRFLLAPTNLVAFLVALSFVIAAVSWWAVLEVVVYLGLDLTLNQILVVILVCQAPMVVFLSLMTVLGKAMSPN